MLDALFENMTHSAKILICLAIILIAGFLLSRITKKLKLPNVTGYILSGILIGPFCLHLVPADVISNMDFVTDIALAFIAFNVGEYFMLSNLKKSGKKIVIITIFESVMASIFIFITMYFIFHLSLSFCLILAAIASATAPASTLMTIRQTKAKGDFVDSVLQIVALDDVVSLVLFSVAVAVANAFESKAKFSFMLLLKPILQNVAIIAIGILFGLIIFLLFKKKRSPDSQLIIAISMILLLSGVCSIFDISPLLGCMMMGTIYINLSHDHHLFESLSRFSPPVLLCFFVLSGMNLNLSSLATLGIIGVVYFIVRIVGKYAGATLGSMITHSTSNNKKYLGLALIPQAGVSIGLASLGARLLPTNLGNMLTTIILSSSILYELMGPACAKLSLYLTKSYEITTIPKVDAIVFKDYSNSKLLKQESKEATDEEILKNHSALYPKFNSIQFRLTRRQK